MIQLQILTGKQAGTRWTARRFPVRIGRAPANDLRLEENGVWERHCLLNFKPNDGFTLTAEPHALLTVNHELASGARLRNGDRIGLGSVHLQFWLNETPQRSQRLREIFVWTLVVAICLTQVALAYWLLR